MMGELLDHSTTLYFSKRENFGEDLLAINIQVKSLRQMRILNFSKKYLYCYVAKKNYRGFSKKCIIAEFFHRGVGSMVFLRTTSFDNGADSSV